MSLVFSSFYSEFSDKSVFKCPSRRMKNKPQVRFMKISNFFRLVQETSSHVNFALTARFAINITIFIYFVQVY